MVWGVGRGSSVASFHCLFPIGVHKINPSRTILDFKEFFEMTIFVGISNCRR